MSDFETLIAVDELMQLVDTPGCRIVDCRFDLMQPDRGKAAYLGGHIPGAVYAHLDDDLAAPVTAATGRHPLPDPAAFAATLGCWGISAASQVVVYDDASGAMAARLWWLLRWLGHRRVALLDGGLDAWIAAGGELQEAVPDVRPETFEADPDEGRVITTDELAAAVAGGEELLLVDARDAPRFAGETEPIDPVAGHVPGARNLPFAASLGPDGRWRSAGELAEAWRAVLGDDAPSDWSTMCGSGVTACHLVLSARIAGLPEPRLYAGSWSEWIRDPVRPVATGDQPG